MTTRKFNNRTDIPKIGDLLLDGFENAILLPAQQNDPRTAFDPLQIVDMTKAQLEARVTDHSIMTRPEFAGLPVAKLAEKINGIAPLFRNERFRNAITRGVDLQAAIAEVQATNATLEATNAGLRNTITSKDVELAAAKDDGNAAQATIVKLENSVANFRKTVEYHRNRIAVKNDELATMKDARKTKIEEIERQHELEKQQTDEKLEAATVDHNKIVKKLGEVEAEKAEADKELSAANAS